MPYLRVKIPPQNSDLLFKIFSNTNSTNYTNISLRFKTLLTLFFSNTNHTNYTLSLHKNAAKPPNI